MTATDAAQLVDQWTPLALSIARRYGAAYNWLLDDLVSDASAALWQAALSWTPDRATFPNWARRRIQWVCSRRIQIERNKNPTAFLAHTRTITSPDGTAVDVAGTIPDRDPSVEDLVERREQVARLPALLARLSPTRRRIIERRFLEEQTAAEVAEAEGVGAKRICQQVARSLELMKPAGEH